MTETDWNKLSPAAMWRDWIVKSEAQWSETVSAMLKDPRSGGMLNKQIEEARLMQRQFAEMAQMALATANLPARSDLEALDERMGRLEDGLAQVGAALVQLRNALVGVGAARQVGVSPPRTRKPPARAGGTPRLAAKG